MTDDLDRQDEPVESVTSSLLRAARANDSEAWSRIVDLYGRLVYWWCRTKGIPEDAAADVGQEVFTAVAQGIDRFDRTRSGQTFRGWLRTIARNKIADYWRRRQATPEVAEAAWENVADDDLSSVVARQELLILHEQIIEFVRGEFADRDWQAFRLYARGDRSAADVADELGISANQVYLAKSRIARRVREVFGDRVGDGGADLD